MTCPHCGNTDKTLMDFPPHRAVVVCTICSKEFPEFPQPPPDVVCVHGIAMDVHCCNCHSGFIFDIEHECDEA